METSEKCGSHYNPEETKMGKKQEELSIKSKAEQIIEIEIRNMAVCRLFRCNRR